MTDPDLRRAEASGVVPFRGLDAARRPGLDEAVARVPIKNAGTALPGLNRLVTDAYQDPVLGLHYDAPLWGETSDWPDHSRAAQRERTIRSRKTTLRKGLPSPGRGPRWYGRQQLRSRDAKKTQASLRDQSGAPSVLQVVATNRAGKADKTPANGRPQRAAKR
jgi:hypothetical protein